MCQKGDIKKLKIIPEYVEVGDNVLDGLQKFLVEVGVPVGEIVCANSLIKFRS